MIAKHKFLTCTVPVVEIEGFAATLARMRLVNQYDPQSTLSNSRIALLKIKINSQLKQILRKQIFTDLPIKC